MADGGLTSDAHTHQHKADFSAVYTEPDPRSLFRMGRRLDYRLPERARPVLRAVLAQAGARTSGTPATARTSGAPASDGPARPITALDLCCSYGIITAALATGPDGGALADHYLDPEVAGLGAGELADRDACSFAGRRPGLRMLGLDVSVPAVDYALRARLLDDAWTENLENEPASDELIAGVRDVDAIISTGGVGYVGVKTFDQLLSNIARPEELWLAVFVLRVFDYGEIVDLLSKYGLVTQKLPNRFRQRRFDSDDEQRAAVRDVRARGLDPTGMESDGWFYADCFISRPQGAAAIAPS